MAASSALHTHVASRSSFLGNAASRVSQSGLGEQLHVCRARVSLVCHSVPKDERTVRQMAIQTYSLVRAASGCTYRYKVVVASNPKYVLTYAHLFTVKSAKVIASTSSSFADLDERKDPDEGLVSVVDEEEQRAYPEEGLVEVGYIVSTHGVQGEMRVHSLTDFPEHRFETPGTRWLRPRSMGRHTLQSVELLEGRVGPGSPPSWLITVENYDTPEKAKDLVGCTVLATANERPPLEVGEFYTPDLLGMTVALLETGEEIGEVVDLVNSGSGNDLLKVNLLPSADQTNGRKIWIPFVEPIVPVVDMERRRVEITPPPGLLELNAPSKKKEEKGNEKDVAKEKRKLRGKIAGLKKRLTAMRQTHILDSLASGSKDDRDALLEQLLTIDFSLLQLAIEKKDQEGITAFRIQYPDLKLIF